MELIETTPLSVKNIKTDCIARLEELIISGQIKIGQQLPPERELARELAITRPILHAAIVDLAEKGLVTIVPRRGVFVNDFCLNGSLPLLISLMNYHHSFLDKDLRLSLRDFRMLVDAEIGRKAAQNASQTQIEDLFSHVQMEMTSLSAPADVLADLDFGFHHLVAVASNNVVYSLLVNSFRIVYTNIAGQMFRRFAHTDLIQVFFFYHTRIAAAISKRQAEEASSEMVDLLKFGIKLMTANQN